MFGQQLPPPFPAPQQQQQQQQPKQQLQQPPPNALPAAHVCQNLICSKFLKYLFSKSKKKNFAFQEIYQDCDIFTNKKTNSK